MFIPAPNIEQMFFTKDMPRYAYRWILEHEIQALNDGVKIQKLRLYNMTEILKGISLKNKPKYKEYL